VRCVSGGTRAGEGSVRERRAFWTLCVAAAACPTAGALLAVGVSSPARVAAALLLFLLAPGGAVLGRRADELGLVVGVSLALDAIAAQLLLWTGHWAPVTATYLLAAICLPILILHLLRMSGRRAPAGLQA
jgi:hypothetical protein